MTPNEARIGNMVLIPTSAEIIIPCFPKLIRGITKFGEFDFTTPSDKHEIIIPAKNCSGIELSYKLFIENGFKQYIEQKIFNRHDICLSYSSNYKGYKLYVNHEYETGKALIYIHELQNLYFVLNGKELSLN